MHATIEAVWRIEAARLIAGVARLVRDVGVAEDLAQEALVAALERWPQAGVPDNPGAWLAATARHRAIDHLRRSEVHRRKAEQLGRELAPASGDPPDPLDRTVDDDLLGLIFTSCHPLLGVEARAVLALRLLCGLSTAEIARAYLSSEPAVAQRLVRAKRTLSAARVQFEMPSAAELPERLEAVLEVVYLVFNEGYAATAGSGWMRLDLVGEALRLGRVLAALMPAESEVHGLVALMELGAGRMPARLDRDGAPVALLDQDRGRWDWLLVNRGLAALGRAREAGPALGRYTLQAEISACHARARNASATDWVRIAALYDLLARVAPSPVVELNRAMAVGMARGPAEGLELVETIAAAPVLRGYHLLHAARGDLLQRLGRGREAADEFRRAAGLTQNHAERAALERRAARVDSAP